MENRPNAHLQPVFFFPKHMSFRQQNTRALPCRALAVREERLTPKMLPDTKGSILRSCYSLNPGYYAQ